VFQNDDSSSCAKIFPVVVVVGHVQVAKVDVTALIMVANEGCFVVVVEVAP
jgi:hypothetical protein